MPLIDSHAHLEASSSLKELRGASVDDLQGVLKRAEAAEVDKIITIGTSLKSSKKAIEIAKKYSSADLQIFATCGLHPKDAKEELKSIDIEKAIEQLKKIAQSSDKVVGIGECGLDIATIENTEIKNESAERKLEYQRELFKAQIGLAAELNLPLIIHCRDGWEEIFRLLSIDDRLLTNLNGVFHSFTGSWNAAKKALDLGFYISFSGIVTFGNTGEIAGVAKKMPLNRMLVETDSPYLSPDPIRGSMNEPKNVRITAQFIADLRDVSLDTIEEVTTKNAGMLFGI